ncbi:MAG: hypothetical protein ACOYXT_09880 [Bacteroidota bacterium]
MKNHVLKSWMALALIAICFFGCDALEEADDVTFDADFDIIFEADENGDGVNVPYSSSETLDISTDPDVNKYLDKIKEVKVNKITYRITGYDASPHNNQVIFNSGTASFGPAGANTKSVTVQYASASGVNLQTTVSETELNIDNTQFATIENIVRNDKKIKMYSEGVLTQTPVAFNVVATFYVTVTANALK